MSERKPNVIIFFTDQQRWDASGLRGNPLNLMPNFDRLASYNTHLDNAITSFPVCGPARACLQSGQYAAHSGNYMNGIELPREIPTLAKVFNEGGYRTGYIGKWHLAGHDNASGPVPEERRGGYQDWLASEVLEFVSDAYHLRLYDNQGDEHLFPGYRVDAQTDCMIRYIHEHKDEPFMLCCSYLEPHHQNHLDSYPPPDSYFDSYTGRWIPPDLAALGGSTHQHIHGYWGMIKQLDDAFGRMMDALKTLDLVEDTIVLFISDHGSHFKTRNGEYKRSCHESSVHVPSLIAGPGFERGGRVTDPVSLIDLPVTLIDAAGLEVPETMQGRSLMPLLRRETSEHRRDVLIQIGDGEHGRAIRTRRWKYCVMSDQCCRNTPSVNAYQEAYLYDLAEDPYELTNLIGHRSHRELADRLQKLLVRRMVEAGESVPTITPPDEMFGPGQRVLDMAVEWDGPDDI